MTTVRGLSFSPNGKLLASGTSDSIIKLWRWDTGELVRSLGAHSAAVSKLAFSPDNKWLATGSEDGSIKLWNPNTGEFIGALEGHASGIIGLAYSHDGKRIVVRTLNAFQIAPIKQKSWLTTYVPILGSPVSIQ